MSRLIRADLSYRPLALQDGNGNAGEFDTQGAKIIEFWLNVTALGASGDYDFQFETSMFELGDAGTIWKPQVTTVNIVASR